MIIDNPPPLYPVDRFHLVAQNTAAEIIGNTKAPDALVATELLTTMSVVIQGLFDIRLPIGKISPLSLYSLSIAESGERKTAVANLLSTEIRKFDEARRKIFEAALVEYEAQLGIWKAVNAGLSRKLKQLVRDGEPIDQISQELKVHTESKPIKPRYRRILFQDVTERAVMNVLEGDGESISFMSDEGALLIKGGVLAMTATLNKIWDGVSLLSLDRSDDVSVAVRNPRATISCMVQAKVLQKLLDKHGEVMRNSGQWARYIVACPASTQGTRFTLGGEQSWDCLNKFNDRMRELLEEFGRHIDSDTKQRTILEFSDEATYKWFDLSNQIEMRLSPSGDLSDIKDFASKLLETTSRVAGLLHVFSKQEGRISVDTLVRAVDIMGWHLDAFKRVFSLEYATPQEHIDAEKLEQFFYNQCWCMGIAIILRNDVLRNGPVRPAWRLNAAMNCLIAERRISIFMGNKKEHYVMLNDAYFHSLHLPIRQIG
ncbi:MAG: YfjI family protein [Herminiimonas sp.]|uniref:YfjI family protein n=1 Tax=Herminiimonas sp. TaxID=1926289 RepID=UPI0027292D9A|nr:YfjI family protein [Herminiimonas sp.]MDO9420323.1 YfjI family protein [Herminiimonas sp.]